MTLLAAATLSAAASDWTPDILWRSWPEERFVAAQAPCLGPADLEHSLGLLQSRHPDLRLEEVGRSVQDRPISMLTVGHGPRKVLLWSRMHGDEPSATPALLDMADFLLRRADEPDARVILSELTLLMVPMLNPDGAELYQRQNAQGIDINRDALNLTTPEGRLLKRLRDEHEPILGFNLHDQNRRTVVGDTGILATNSVLAVAGDPAGTVTAGRLRAMRACSAIASALAPYAPGGMGRFDEDWSPRAFGDNLTAWGTPVVLIESGGLPAGRDVSELTRLNFVALLTVLRDLAHDDLAAHDRQLYDELPRNQRNAWVDVVVRGGSLLQPAATIPYRADLAFNVKQGDRERAGCSLDPVGGSSIVEVGDARFLASGHDVDATGHLVMAPFIVGVKGWRARHWLGAEQLALLTRWGVGTVRWVVARGRLEAAVAMAREMEAPGRARLRVSTDAADLPPLRLSGPAAEPKSVALDDVLSVLGGKAWRRQRVGKSLLEALRWTWSADGPAPPVLAPGGSASFLLVLVGKAGVGKAAVGTAAGENVEGARLVAVWLDGRTR